MYEIEPVMRDKQSPKQEEESKNESPPVLPVKYSYLAISQRKLELVPGSFLHPFNPVVFGSPLLVRIRDLEGFTGKDLYSLISRRMQHFVPHAASREESSQSSDNNSTTNEAPAPITRQARRGRHHRQKTTADMEALCAGETPSHGFRLRLVSRDGSRCALCPWYSSCVGCVVPCDDYPAIAMCGDSIAVDWHLSVDLSGGGFGWKVGSSDGSGINVQASPHTRAQSRIKKHSSFDTGGKRYGYSGSITLEECLDSFAKEERIPEVSNCVLFRMISALNHSHSLYFYAVKAYCSNCKEFRVQTKRLSIWRCPPLAIIQFKRFQFTQHMKRKLRDLVVFPIDGMDLSRIVAPSSSGLETKMNGEHSGESKEDVESSVASGGTQGSFHPLSPNNCGRTESSYDLYGVIHHQGALSGGHYVASLKSEQDGKWRLFNDAQIYDLLSRDVVDPSAYILFYVRRDVKGATLEDFWDAKEREGEGLTEEEVEKMMKKGDRCVIS